MSYTCALSLKKIKDYLAGAAVVGFDFETSPIEEYRSEERVALDAHKAAITGVSLSVSEDSGIYIPLRHRAGRNIQRPEAVMDYLRQAVFENATVIKVAHIRGCGLCCKSTTSWCLSFPPTRWRKRRR